MEKNEDLGNFENEWSLVTKLKSVIKLNTKESVHKHYTPIDKDVSYWGRY